MSRSCCSERSRWPSLAISAAVIASNSRGQVAELVLRRVVEAARHVAAPDRRGGLVQAVHRQQHATLHHEAAGQQQENHHARHGQRDPLEFALRRAALHNGILEPLVGVVAHRLRVGEQLVEQRLLAACREAVVAGRQLLQAGEQRRQRGGDVAQLGERRVVARLAVVGQRRGDGRMAQVPLLAARALRSARTPASARAGPPLRAR